MTRRTDSQLQADLAERSGVVAVENLASRWTLTRFARGSCPINCHFGGEPPNLKTMPIPGTVSFVLASGIPAAAWSQADIFPSHVVPQTCGSENEDGASGENGQKVTGEMKMPPCCTMGPVSSPEMNGRMSSLGLENQRGHIL